MTDDLLPKEKISILPAEYGTLRSEILQRSTWQIQMGAAGAAAAGVAFGLMVSVSVLAGTILLLVAIVAFVVGMCFNDSEMKSVVEAVKSLERRINDLAGEELLSWETRRGLSAAGHAQRWRQFLSGSSN